MAKATCSIEDCDRPVKYVARALCGRCYLRKWKMGEIDQEIRGRACTHCGAEIRGRTARAVYCSVECSRKVARRSMTQRERRALQASKAGKRCLVCATDISILNAQAKFCGQFCRERASGYHQLGPSIRRACALPDCGEPFETFLNRTRCCSELHGKRLWNRESRADGRQAQQYWNEARRAAYHRRRALKRGASIGEPFTNEDIFERDRWACQLCGYVIDPEVKWPHPKSASLDHVVPLSRGGAHSRANTQLACLECNVRKGNRAAGEQLALLG